MTVAETEHAAIIGAVAVLPSIRGKESVPLLYKVYCIIAWQSIRSISMCIVIQKKNALFYRTMGFTDSGVWAELEQI